METNGHSTRIGCNPTTPFMKESVKPMKKNVDVTVFVSIVINVPTTIKQPIRHDEVFFISFLTSGHKATMKTGVAYGLTQDFLRGGVKITKLDSSLHILNKHGKLSYRPGILILPIKL